MREWLKSFRYAYEGIVYALQTQKNMKFHFLAAFVVLVIAIMLELTKVEILFILLAVTLILVTELINTAVEKAVDLAMPDPHPLAKIAKDVAAASVLVSAFFAVVVGVIVFYEPLLEVLFRRALQLGDALEIGPVWVITCLVLLAAIVLHMQFSERKHSWRPSLISALSFAVSTMIVLQTGEPLPALLALGLSVLIGLILYDKTARSLASIIGGGLLGMIVTICFYLLL